MDGKGCRAMWLSLCLYLSHTHTHTHLIIRWQNQWMFLNMALTSRLPFPSLSFHLFLSFSAEVGWFPAQAEEIMQQHPIFRPLFDRTSLSAPLCSTRLCSVNYRFGCMCFFFFSYILLDLIVVKRGLVFISCENFPTHGSFGGGSVSLCCEMSTSLWIFCQYYLCEIFINEAGSFHLVHWNSQLSHNKWWY